MAMTKGTLVHTFSLDSLFVLFCLLHWDLLDRVSPNCILGTITKLLARVHEPCFMAFQLTMRKLLNFEVFIN